MERKRLQISSPINLYFGIKHLVPLRILLLALLAPVAVFAQNEASLPIFTETANYRIEEFKLPGGQPANNVNCIVQVPRSFYGSVRTAA